MELSSGRILLTEQPGAAYRVTGGRVLVFVLPVDAGGARGRRLLLTELGEGAYLPSLCAESAGADHGDSCRWHFGLTALDTATLIPVQPDARLEAEFARGAGLRDYASLGLEESAAEFYRLSQTRELRNIYVAQQERQRAESSSLELIRRIFSRRQLHRDQGRERTGNRLYDAIATLAGYQRMEVVPLNTLLTNCGRNFSEKDAARLSGFICRDVLLGENWFRQDNGPLLVQLADGSGAAVCIPRGRSGYSLYDPSDDSLTPITARNADRIRPRAAMFYRAFPRKKLTMRDVFSFALGDLNLRDVGSVLLFTLLGTLIGLLTPYLNELMYDVLIPMSDASGLMGVCLAVLSCTVGNISFSIVKNLASFRALTRMKYSVQAAVIDRLFGLPESFYRGKESADLGERALGVSEIFASLAASFAGVGLSAIFSVVYLVRMFLYSDRLSWAGILMLIPSMAVILLFGWLQMRHERTRLELGGQLSSSIYQILGGISKLRIAGAEDRALLEYMRGYTQACAVDMKLGRYGLWSQIVNGAVSTVFSIVLYSVTVSGPHTLSVGEFMGFTTAFGAFSGAMMAVVSTFLELNAVGPALERMKPILETLPEHDADSAMPGEITGEIELNNVTFSYDPEAAPALRDVSLHIRPGEYVGIVGPSGCGKSTLLKLLLGFEKPQTGRIYYDGKDIDALDKRELRKRLGVVLQDGGLITGSIYENITITQPGATRQQVEEAVAAAGMKGDIADMPMGLHTLLSEGDGSISGGQRQRVLIARAIVGKPRVLFLDEATSALDNATQAAVIESLDRLSSTRVVIAHRLSTIMGCDRILVMEAGRIVEEGSFEELMEQKGRFWALASRQMV